MILSERVSFDMIDFDNLEIPQYIVKIEKGYNEELEKSNYILEQGQYDEYTAKFARIYDWYCLQYARASYLKKSVENDLNSILMEQLKLVPDEIKTKAARENYAKQNSEAYQKLYKTLAKSIGYFDYFEGKKDATKLKHYVCKGMSNSIDVDKPIGGYA